ncbi:hypothetical protein J3R82DRAFT_10866 [Butyriboletus roseoflavus]|nr:hypothetical protein J3R82DRAFT_10866 [Butyriboletus roseoflavus]
MMSTLNPSHILIARNSRGHNNPSASLSSPTETHAAAAGIFRSSGSPQWLLEECDNDELVTELNLYESDQAIEIDDTFTRRNGRFPGTVKIVVESTTFWAHKEVLFFASPFFEAALSGSWLETGRPPSMSSVITISQPPSIPGSKSNPDVPAAMSFTPEDGTHDSSSDTASDCSSPVEIENPPASESEASESEPEQLGSTERKAHARGKSLAKLQGSGDAKHEFKGKYNADRSRSQNTLATLKRRRRTHEQDAVIVLKEEKASIFHDFLKFVYPHLHCNISWNNVEGLMNISHKLCVPALQQECLTFLLTHAAGKPIKAMRIAELFEEEELYRESSRFVLDNPGGWSEEELSTLSQETLLKLEKRRNWFLERVLKLGLTPLAKEYQCCPTCPDTTNCARLLEEKWRQAYNAVFRFGPCQPSMVYRYLRNLEGVSPPLSLTHLTCQTTAKAFTATCKRSTFHSFVVAPFPSLVILFYSFECFLGVLTYETLSEPVFDRMFSLGIRGDVTLAPLGTRVAAVAAASGPRRHFLYCTLKPDKTGPRTRRSRELP